MKTAIHQRALDLGFDACRFTTADPPASAPRFNQWLAAQRHGEMAYLHRNAHKRVDPQQVLPGARSVICLAVSYEVQRPRSDVQSAESADENTQLGSSRGNEAQTSSEKPSATASQSLLRPSATNSHTRCKGDRGAHGIIARYARFADYHDVLRDQLGALTEFMNQLGGPGTRSLWYVDTGPFLERDLAQRAGLGFIGKHTNLISRRLGNWIFLAEIITTLELEPDTPEKNRCGTCTRCIEACPTRAITGPFQLDARLCISYLTIELKGPIPVDLRPAIGNRIFGCDDCLAACPWNRFAREGNLMREHERHDLDQPQLVRLLELSEAEFKRRFADTPLARTKRRGLIRNACVALGNVGDESALPSLQRVANDSDGLIAEHARWATDQILSRNHAVSFGERTGPACG